MEKSLPLFKTLKKCIKKSDFHWKPDAEQAFKQLKQHLARLPMLILPGASHRGHHRPAHQADFLVEKPDDAPPEASVIKTSQEPWTLFTDGSSCVDGSGVGLILTSQEGTEFNYALRFQFTDSNNEAEYEALIAGLRIATQMGVRNVHVSVDSKLVANQVLGTYVAKEENMVKYLEKAKSMISGFANFSISQVPRSKNKKADALSKIVSRGRRTNMDDPDNEYLKDGTLLGDRNEASKLRIKARQYELLEGVLYKRSFLKSWLRCIGSLQADYVILEIHEGPCGPFPKGPHKVDRGESCGNNHRQSGEEVCVGQHSMPLRSPERNSLGQR
nr:reverse transcriptase domain-containing protein [Tanacetum cinerariifolium]